MKVATETLELETGGSQDMKDLTPAIVERLSATGLDAGTVTVFVPGSTGGVTTIEHEPGLVADFERLMERLAPSDVTYDHDRRWGDGNGYSHLRASLLGPSLTVPFTGGALCLGTWQQVVFVDFDNQPRRRTIVLQFMGE